MMNKREKAAYDDALSAVAAARALGWPTEKEPQPVPREEIRELARQNGGLFVGWWFHHYDVLNSGATYRSVGQGCSSGYAHSTSHTDRTQSQGCGVFYRTRDDALLALRWFVCQKAAKALAWIDAARADPTTQ